MTKKSNWLVYLGADQPPLGLEKASVVWGLTVASDYLPDTTRQPYNEVNSLSDGSFLGLEGEGVGRGSSTQERTF